MIAILNGFGRAEAPSSGGANPGAGYDDGGGYDTGRGSSSGSYRPLPVATTSPPAGSGDGSAANNRVADQPKKQIDFVKYGMIAGGVALVAIGIYAAYKYENKLKLDKVFNGHFSRTRRTKK